MKKFLPFCVALLALVVTGCPHNEYKVELTPHGNVIERKLVFYRENSRETNGVVKYDGFPAGELALITNLYPAGSLTNHGERYVVRSEFATAMPDDVGGYGTYSNVTTSVGSAGFYAERFRGNPDQATVAANRNKAADELTDLVIGWSKAELGGEPQYKDLREFLDVDFRRDLKNAGLYWREWRTASASKTNAADEFVVRFGQYLVERGYVKFQEVPGLMRAFSGDDEQTLMRTLRKLVASKLGITESSKSLGFLADAEAMGKSWNHYLEGTEAYAAKIKQWEKDKETTPDLKKPDPIEVTAMPFETLFDFELFSDPPDHLTVHLVLPQAPSRTNGKWDEDYHRVVWESDLEGRTNAVRLPVFCYACWGQANEKFQTEHFGRVILDGDGVLAYCLWYDGLNEKNAGEWDAMLASVKAGEGLMEKVDAFRFSGEAVQAVSNPAKPKTDGANVARELFRSELGEKPKVSGK